MEFPSYFPRTYDGRRHSAWNPSISEDGSGGRGGSGRQHQHHGHPKHVAFKAEEEEIIRSNSNNGGVVFPEENVVSYKNDSSNNPPNGVDEEADAFIKHEHSRIRLARLRSINPY